MVKQIVAIELMRKHHLNTVDVHFTPGLILITTRITKNNSVNSIVQFFEIILLVLYLEKANRLLRSFS